MCFFALAVLIGFAAGHANWLLEEMLRARSVEGGFRDTSINGWPFDTAMALTAMHELFTR